MARVPSVVLALLSASLLALFVLPIVAIATYVPFSQILAVASDPAVDASLEFTLLASGIALALAVFLGVPLGYVLARRRFPGHALVESVVTLPVVLPHLVAGLALLFLFAPEAPLGAFADRMGFPVVSTIWGVVLVMAYVGGAYTVLATAEAFRAIDPELLETARTLGASRGDVFLSVTFPLAFRGILTGALLTWARSVSEIGGLLILAYTVVPSPPYGGPVTQPITVYVYNLYALGDTSAALAVSSLLILVSFALFLAVRLLEARGRMPWRGRVLVP